MLIALLVVLGVDLIVIVVVGVLVFGRRRWLKRQRGAFTGAIRVSGGDVDGLSTKWKRGSGRWVNGVLIWSKAPFWFRTEPVAIDRRLDERPAQAGKLKKLGDNPVVIEFASGDARIDVAAEAEHRTLLTGPFATSPGAPTGEAASS